MAHFHLPGHEEVVGVVNIASGSSEAALISLRPGMPSRILASAHSLIALQEETPGHSVATIRDRMDQVLKQLRAQADTVGITAPVRTVYCCVASSWSRSVITRKHRDFAAETIIARPVIEALAKEALADAAEFESKTVLEASVFRFWLDGYVIAHPEGRSSRSISLAAIVSSVSHTIKNNCLASIRNSFPVARVEWRSGTRTVLEVFGAVAMSDENYLAIDIGVDATEILSVRDGMVISREVLHVGLRSILTRIDTKRSPEETLSLIRMLSRDACKDDACAAIQTAMAVAEPALAKEFGQVLGTIAAERRLSNNLYLVAHQDIIHWMTQFFSRLDFTQFTATTLPFSVTPFGNELVASWITEAAQSQNSLALSCALVNIESRE